MCILSYGYAKFYSILSDLLEVCHAPLFLYIAGSLSLHSATYGGLVKCQQKVRVRCRYIEHQYQYLLGIFPVLHNGLPSCATERRQKETQREVLRLIKTYEDRELCARYIGT